MVPFQVAFLAIVAAFVVYRARLEADPKALYRRLFLLALSAWMAEDTCVRAYGFHTYRRDLWPLLDRVPLVIVLIWPVVIQSARDLGTCLWRGRDRPSAERVALTVFGLVLADVALIEPIAVQSGLWRWAEPGLFAVPPIGMLGRALFAAIAAFVFERAAWLGRPWLEGLVLPIAPVGTHVLLFGAWWCAFRWVNVALAAWPAAVVVWVASVALAARAWKSGARHRVPPALLWLRAPAALLVFVL